ncbi:hypothetical protein AAAU52_14030 [Blautia hansenii]
MAVREYHYQTGQVMAIKGDKSFTWTLTVSARFTGKRSWRISSNGSLSA